MTVERILIYKHITEERCYMFDKKNKKVIEMFYYYRLDNADEISEMRKDKSMLATMFIFNLEVIMDHPGVTFKDQKFIMWYSKQILDDKF
jgi:hypothetical protein